MRDNAKLLYRCEHKKVLWALPPARGVEKWWSDKNEPYGNTYNKSLVETSGLS